MFSQLNAFKSSQLNLLNIIPKSPPLIEKNESAISKISNSLNDLNENIKNGFESIQSMFEFFGKVGDFFKESLYWITHPAQLLDAFQPWFVIGLMIMIVLRMLGFNIDKWFRLFFLLFILSLIF